MSREVLPPPIACAKHFDEQLAVQVDEGVDFIIGETFSWLGEALIAVERAKATGLARDGHDLL
jgi:methionine synthase I (cobalamin-dependent)